MEKKEEKKVVKKKRMAFGQFAQQPHIKGLCLSEKRKKYNVYIR